MKNLININTFNTLYPVGSTVLADVYIGQTEVTVTKPATLVSETGEACFYASYANQYNGLIPLDWVLVLPQDIINWFNTTYPVDTWVYCINDKEQYATKVESPAALVDDVIIFAIDGSFESIANVCGRVKLKIEFVDEGQDFTAWYINEANEVVDCTPYEKRSWLDYTVELQSLTTGSKISYTDSDGFKYSLRHPVKNLVFYPAPKIESEVSNG